MYFQYDTINKINLLITMVQYKADIETHYPVVIVEVPEQMAGVVLRPHPGTVLWPSSEGPPASLRAVRVARGELSMRREYNKELTELLNVCLHY